MQLSNYRNELLLAQKNAGKIGKFCDILYVILVINKIQHTKKPGLEAVRVSDLLWYNYVIISD